MDYIRISNDRHRLRLARLEQKHWGFGTVASMFTTLLVSLISLWLGLDDSKVCEVRPRLRQLAADTGPNEKISSELNRVLTEPTIVIASNLFCFRLPSLTINRDHKGFSVIRYLPRTCGAATERRC